jgi:hypothetical protein
VNELQRRVCQKRQAVVCHGEVDNLEIRAACKMDFDQVKAGIRIKRGVPGVTNLVLCEATAPVVFLAAWAASCSSALVRRIFLLPAGAGLAEALNCVLVSSLASSPAGAVVVAVVVSS